MTPPATLAAYKITLAEVADLSQGFDPDIWDGAWHQWDCAWRQIARIDKKVPPSWKLADLVITAGLRGILFPSLRHAGGTNLIIFPANLVDGDRVAVHDPDHTGCRRTRDHFRQSSLIDPEGCHDGLSGERAVFQANCK
ncbi:RES domain-containing protein [Mesorhizobium sp.]|uniref:RES domain-containing protein n=1 Tax=Mesorhizobium sp. TaxID=1871066 RepID=UPI0025C1E4FB|nr:RES domain-containing protein [Mesorhizobium sp.]